jgi:allantoate deiminase
MAVAALCPIGVLFTRCKGGMGHNPAEAITAADAEVALRMLIDVLCRFTPPA